MASASITFVLNRLADQAVMEAALLRGVDKDIRLLRDKLEWLQIFIQHADQERRKGANNYIALYVRQTRDVAHEVEDVLDAFLRKADLDKLAAINHPAWSRWLKLATNFITQVAVRHHLREKIDGIKDRLKEISDNVDKYWTKKLRSSASSSSSAANNSSVSTVAAWDEDIEVFGFEKEYKELEDRLRSSESRRSVISIVGESGIGKSTLAWKVYDSSIIMKDFQVRAWINVPPQIKENDILYFIYKRVCPEDGEDKSLTTETVHNALSRYLSDKRYLVMVDGLANFTNLNCILQSLPDNNMSSRVMIITHLEDKEAVYADPQVKPLKITKLNRKDSGDLFCRKVFGAKNQPDNKVSGVKSLQPAQVEQGCNMYEITGGLTLGTREVLEANNQPDNKVFGGEILQPSQVEQACNNMYEITELPLATREVFGTNNQPDNKVFGGEILTAAQVENACDNVYEITGGLPLAIVLLAGLLRRRNFKEWHKVFQPLRSSEEHKKVKRILALSFDDLPSRLKSCFLYFAGMPENLIFNARRIVRLWAAEGFLKPKKGKTMEDIGQNYLKELISRGMVHLVKKDLNGGVWLVAIHDRLHAFAQLEAHEASFLEVHDNADVLAPASMRRLYLQNYMQSYNPMDTSFPKLRSILCDFAEERSQNSVSQKLKGSLNNQASSSDLHHHALHFLPHSKFLRIIDLRGLRIKEVPNAIGDMIHVRYLGLRSRTLTTLPRSIVRLINLQTLDIKRTEVDKVAQAFWKIPTLRHVVAANLQLPQSVGALNNMQTLTGLVCKHPWTNNLCPLDSMVYLRNLEISGLKKHHWAGLADTFRKLESLLYLHLAGDGIQSKLFTRFTLRRLQILELFGKIDTSDDKPEDRYTLPNLTRIVLKQSKVDQKFMDKIGELPSLMELVLCDESYTEKKLLLSDSGFNSVTNLVMAKLPELLEWEIRPGSIPMIKRIALSECPEMKIKLECKEGEGLEKLMKHLKEVVVWNMPKGIHIEPENSAFEKMISSITMKTKSEGISSAMQRTGRWRAAMVSCDMYQD